MVGYQPSVLFISLEQNVVTIATVEQRQKTEPGLICFNTLKNLRSAQIGIPSKFLLM